MRKNSLDSVPVRSGKVSWVCSECGEVTLSVKNQGVCNLICQRFLMYPKTSRITLDKIGSEVWVLLDGRRSILAIGKKISEKFGSDAEPLYERLTLYIKELCNNKMVRLNKPEKL